MHSYSTHLRGNLLLAVRELLCSLLSELQFLLQINMGVAHPLTESYILFDVHIPFHGTVRLARIARAFVELVVSLYAEGAAAIDVMLMQAESSRRRHRGRLTEGLRNLKRLQPQGPFAGITGSFVIFMLAFDLGDGG